MAKYIFLGHMTTNQILSNQLIKNRDIKYINIQSHTWKWTITMARWLGLFNLNNFQDMEPSPDTHKSIYQNYEGRYKDIHIVLTWVKIGVDLGFDTIVQRNRVWDGIGNVTSACLIIATSYIFSELILWVWIPK